MFKNVHILFPGQLFGNTVVRFQSYTTRMLSKEGDVGFLCLCIESP